MIKKRNVKKRKELKNQQQQDMINNNTQSNQLQMCIDMATGNETH